jgi:hypothetical protein
MDERVSKAGTKFYPYWVRFTHYQAGKCVGRGKFIAYGQTPSEAFRNGALILEAKGHVLDCRITSVKPKA